MVFVFVLSIRVVSIRAISLLLPAKAEAYAVHNSIPDIDKNKKKDSSLTQSSDLSASGASKFDPGRVGDSANQPTNVPPLVTQ